MIRFIDLRGQGTGHRFAFWNTTSDKFLSFCGEEAWNGWEELVETVEAEDRSPPDRTATLARLRNLCPDWVHDGNRDDVGLFYLGGDGPVQPDHRPGDGEPQMTGEGGA